MKTTIHFRSFAIAMILAVISMAANAQRFWEDTKGPYGINLWAFLVTKDGTYYGGSGDGRVFRRLPGEDRWKTVLNTPGTILLLYEAEDGIYAGDANGMLERSIDNGDSWESMNAGLQEEPQVRAMVVNANGDYFAGTSSGIYKRVPGKKGGFSWELKPFTTQYGMFIFSLCMDKNNVLYAGAGRGIYRSDDDGETWTLSGLDELPNSIMSLAANDQGDVWAGTSEQGLMVNYADDGEDNVWTTVGGELMEGKQARKVSVVDGNKLFVSLSNVGIAYSENGTDWDLILDQDNRAGMYYDAATDQLAAGTLTGIWTSPADGNFDFSHIGLPLDISYLTSYKSKIIAMTDNNTRLYESSDQGETWSLFFSNGEGVVTSYAEKDNEDKFVGCKGGFTGSPWVQSYIYLDFEGSRGWWSIGFPENVNEISDLLVTSKDSIYVATDDGLYYIHTKRYESARISKIANGVNILSLSEDIAGNIYAATNDGLYISMDNGFHWSEPFLTGMTINGLAFGNEEEIYVATDDGLYFISSFEGEPVILKNGLESGAFLDVAKDAHGHLYTTSSNGVYYTPDTETDWTLAEEGAEGYHYRNLYSLDNAVYLGTDVGLYKHTYAQLATVSLTGTGNFTYNGEEHAAAATTVPAGLPVTLLYNGLTDVPVDGGNYQITAVVNDPAYAGQATGRIMIGKAAATITLSGLGTRSYTGDPVNITATTVPAALPVVFTYNGQTEVPVEIGEYYVIAVIDHPSYKGQAAGDLIIQDPILGTEDPMDKLLTLSPVPAADQIVIESKQDKIRSIQVCDAMGRPLEQVKLVSPVKSHTLKVDRYPVGVLLFSITTDKNEMVVKRGMVIH